MLRQTLIHKYFKLTGSWAWVLVGLLWPICTQGQEEEVLLSFRHPDVGHIYVNSLHDYASSQSYLPVLEIFSRLEINYSADIRNFTIRGIFLDPSNQYSINLSAMQVVMGKTSYPLLAEDFRISELDYYLSPKVFEDVFGLNFTVNLMHLVLSLETTHTLPVAERKARERQRSRMESRDMLQANYPMGFDRNRRILGGTMLDYSVNANYTQKAQSMNYSLTGGMEVLGGDLQGTLHGIQSSDGYNSVDFSNARWRYAIRDNNFLSGISLGKISTTGLQPFSIRGIAITNDPIEPRRLYETYVIDGNTEAESEVELFVNDRLTDYKRADELGYYRFDVPIMYGTTLIGLRIYTPAGEVIVNEKQLQVPFTFLPKGVITYNIQAGQAEQMISDTLENMLIKHGNLAVGISKWLSASAGAQHSGEGFNVEDMYYYGTLSARIAKQYLFNLDLAPEAFYRLTSSVLYSNNLSFNFIYTRFDGHSMFNTRGAIEDLAANVFIPVRFWGINSGLRIGLDQTLTEVTRLTRFRADFNTRLRNFNLRFNYHDNFITQEGQHYSGQGILTTSVTYTISRSPGIPVYIRGMFLRWQTAYDVRNNLFQTSDIQLSRTLFRTGRINIAASYDHLNDQVNAQIGFTLDLNRVRSSTTIASNRDQISARQSLTGSVGLDMINKHAQFNNRQQVGRSATAVRLFVDNNNSGAYDDGDQLLPYRGVKLDRTTTMEVGRDSILRINQLQNYFLYNMSVNRNAIPDPTLVPMLDEFSFIADPNQYKPIDIPFYRGGIIEGSVRIERNGQVSGQGGLRIFLKAIDGDYRQTIRSFEDGGFYAMDIPPGRYSLQVDEAQLVFLEAIQQKVVEFEIHALAEGDYIEGLNLLLIHSHQE